MSLYPDEQLVLEALDDSHPAFEQLIEQYQYGVLRTIASIISDDLAAHDVAQETFLLAWRDLPKLKEKQKFGGWLNQIAINLSKHWLRDQRKYQEHTASLKDMISSVQELSYHSEKLRQEVWEAIDGLTDDYREAVILYYISGYSYKEISEMLSVPVSTVRGRLQEARNQLRKEFLDMVTKLQLEIDSTVHKFLKEHAKQNGMSVEGLIIRLIERYRRDADLSGVMTRQIWGNALDCGSVSPDGRFLSYVNWDKGNVAIHDFETGENRDLTDEGTWEKDMQFVDSSTWTAWSPDSKQIAYAWYSGPSTGSRIATLRVVGIHGSKPRVIYSSPAKSEVILPRVWSQDGKYILAVQCKNTDGVHSEHVILVSMADSSIRVLRMQPPKHGHGMSLSPDGRYVIYDCPQNEDSENRDIFLLSTDGNRETTLVEHPADDFAPLWAPDGDHVVFASDRSGSIGVWALKVVDGRPEGSPQLISDNLNGMSPLGFTQDGSYYYRLPGRENDIYFADLDLETGEVMTPPTKAVQSHEGFNYAPAFSPDGKRLAYASLRPKGGNSNFRAIVIRSLETGEERELSPKLTVIGQFACWSPDERSILTSAWGTYGDKKSLGIYQIDTESDAATPVVLSDDKRGYISSVPLWYPDGSKVFFMRRRYDIRFIKVYDFETEREWELDFQLACGGSYGSGLALSPDGQHLAFVVRCDNGWSLQIAPSSGGDTREIARLREEETHWGRGLTWMPDGRYLLFPGNKDEANGLCELWRISVEGGEPQNLGLTMKLHGHLSVHPDGRRIAFTGPGPKPGGEVWAMENFLP